MVEKIGKFGGLWKSSSNLSVFPLHWVKNIHCGRRQSIKVELVLHGHLVFFSGLSSSPESATRWRGLEEGISAGRFKTFVLYRHHTWQLLRGPLHTFNTSTQRKYRPQETPTIVHWNFVSPGFRSLSVECRHRFTAGYLSILNSPHASLKSAPADNGGVRAVASHAYFPSRQPSFVCHCRLISIHISCAIKGACWLMLKSAKRGPYNDIHSLFWTFTSLCMCVRDR